MLGHDGEQRNGFLNATRLGPRVMEKGASLDHIVARVQQKNGPWVWRLGGDKRTLSPQNASMSSGVRLLTPRKTGELSRGARLGELPQRERASSESPWFHAARSPLVEPCPGDDHRFPSCSHAQLLTRPGSA